MFASRRAMPAVALSAILALVLAVAATGAQTLDTLRVDFVIDDPGLAERAGSRAALVADSLASQLTRSFGLWVFRAGWSPDSSACRVTLLGGAAERLRLEILDRRGDPIGSPWERAFRDPNTPAPLPNWRTGMPVLIPAVLDQRLLAPAHDTLLAILARSHPVTTLHDFHLPDTVFCALPLPFSRFDVYSTSVFLIVGSSPTAGTVLVRSTGTGNAMPWNGPPAFLGVSVKHRSWEANAESESISVHLAELHELKNVKVLIDRVVRNTLAHVFDEPTGASH
jgi:hypothetical protein